MFHAFALLKAVVPLHHSVFCGVGIHVQSGLEFDRTLVCLMCLHVVADVVRVETFAAYNEPNPTLPAWLGCRSFPLRRLPTIVMLPAPNVAMPCSAEPVMLLPWTRMLWTAGKAVLHSAALPP